MNFNPAPKKYPTWADVPEWQFIARRVKYEEWQNWFAWYPVKMHGTRVWLTTICRRRITKYVDIHEWSYYEYGTLFDVLKGEQ
jgi:hypothetical protein